MKAEDDAVASVSWSPDGQFLAAGSFCSGLYYYDTSCGKPIHNFASKERIAVTAFNGPHVLAIGSYDGLVTI